MKHVFVIAVFFSLLIMGCQSDNPISSPPHTGLTSAPQFLQLPARADGLRKIVTARAFITAAQGGVLQLADSYVDSSGSTITINISLTFAPGDLPYDADLTLTIDDVYFLSTVDMTFGPHGIVFNNPAKLNMCATGMSLDPTTAAALKLYYDNSGTWDRMPASNAVYQSGATTIDGHGKLPHFSRYAFGR